jgi:predicted transcriptional regulator
MKKILLMIVLVFGFLSSCKKEEEEVKPSYADCAAIQNAISISDARIRQLQTNLAQASLESRERIIKSIASERENNANLLNQKSSMGC